MSSINKEKHVATIANTTVVSSSSPQLIEVHKDYFDNQFYPTILVTGIAGSEVGKLWKVQNADGTKYAPVPDSSGSHFTFTASRGIGSVDSPGTYAIDKPSSTNDWIVSVQF